MHGYRSCADWLSATCGIAPSTAREQVRVARALTRLTAAKASFAAGRISYSKVRALTRIATPEDEADLVVQAESLTGAEFDRLARSRRGKPEKKARGDRSFLTWRQDPDGGLVVEGWFAPEDAARMLAAWNALQESAAHSPAPATASPVPRADGAETAGTAAADTESDIAEAASPPPEADAPRSKRATREHVARTNAEILVSLVGRLSSGIAAPVEDAEVPEKGEVPAAPPACDAPAETTGNGILDGQNLDVPTGSQDAEPREERAPDPAADREDPAFGSDVAA